MLGLSSVALAKERQVYYDTRHDPPREFHEPQYICCCFGFDTACCLGRNAADLAVRIPTNLLSKAKTSELRRCFRDADQNRKCDRSVKDGGKCKKNCVSPAKAKSTNPALKPSSGKASEDNTVGNLMIPDCRHGLHFACLGCGACLKG